MRLSAQCWIYAAVMIWGAAAFFWLHHLGNQIPYGVAQQRFAEAFESRPDEGHALGLKSEFEYCQVSSAVLASADGTRVAPFPRIAVLRVYHSEESGYCGALRDAAHGAALADQNLKTRYWWGGKALYAIALRHVSVSGLRELTRAITYLAFGLLAVALLLHSARMLLIFTPLIGLGVYRSGVDYFADVLNGMPFAWTILAAAILALVLRPTATARPGQRSIAPVAEHGARLFCFVAGMVSAFLWMGDGHQPLAIALLGLIAFFADERNGIRRACWCVGLFLAGHAMCHGLGLAIKSVMIGIYSPKAFLVGAWEVFDSFWLAFVNTVERTEAMHAANLSQIAKEQHRSFAALNWSVNARQETAALTGLSAFALLAAGVVAGREAMQGRKDALRGVLCIVAMLLMNLPNFLIAEDIPFRTSRFMFILHGLSFASLIVAAWHIRWGVALLAGGMIGVYAIAAAYSTNRLRAMLDWVDATQPMFESVFDVYRAGNRLIYVRDSCATEHTQPRFFVHAWHQGRADGPPSWRQLFSFTYGAWHNGIEGGRCLLVQPLPGGALAGFSTGQRGRDGAVWQVDYRSGALRGADGEAAFDLHFDWRQLRYARAPCRMADASTRFFLHVYREDRDGFDNMDFWLPAAGTSQDECKATVQMPDYEVSRVRTGQYTSGEGEHWSVLLERAR